MGVCCSSEPEQPPNPLQIDLSHFSLLKVVGKGGFGKVNAIQRKQTNELMALKRMNKAEVIKKESHIRMVWTERDIMARLNSPFLVNLTHAFQDEKELYLVMPFQQGGDLRFHLSKMGCLSEEDARFYTCGIILGLQAMHSINVVYRDLKPDNVLLDIDGNIRISDFGLSVELKEKNNYRIRGNAGTSGYLAPEVCTGEPYGLSCDVWTLGICVYEMIHGRRPFKQWKPTDTVDPCLSLKFGSNVSEACQTFIRGLLTINPSKRLGCGKQGWDEVIQHPWFATVDWDAIRARSIRAPIQPDPDQANCNNSADLADQLMDKEPESIPPEQQKHFLNFEFHTDYKEHLARVERENNLAGLNLSQATDVGPIGSHTHNASHMNSHMIDPPTRVVDTAHKRSTGTSGTVVTVAPPKDGVESSNAGGVTTNAVGHPPSHGSVGSAISDKYLVKIPVTNHKPSPNAIYPEPLPATTELAPSSSSSTSPPPVNPTTTVAQP